jgi:hypothetical protein
MASAAFGTSSAPRTAISLAQSGTQDAVHPEKLTVSIRPMKDPAFMVRTDRDHF